MDSHWWQTQAAAKNIIKYLSAPFLRFWPKIIFWHQIVEKRLWFFNLSFFLMFVFCLSMIHVDSVNNAFGATLSLHLQNSFLCLLELYTAMFASPTSI